MHAKYFRYIQVMLGLMFAGWLSSFGCSQSSTAERTCDTAGVEPIRLFNGKDLTGWKAEGGASWEVKDGLLIGRQGPNNAAGDLFTEAEYTDFELLVTYRVVWPANTGIWFRYQSAGQAYQADILEYAQPEAYSGTIYCPGKLFLAINADKDLVNRDGWNTLRVRAEGPRLRVRLNDVLVGDVTDTTTDRGRIGLQVHEGDMFGSMAIIVREMVLRPLGTATP